MEIEKITCTMRQLKTLRPKPNTLLELRTNNKKDYIKVFFDRNGVWQKFCQRNSDLVFLWVSDNFADIDSCFVRTVYVMGQDGVVPDFITHLSIDNKESLRNIRLHDKVENADFSFCENLETISFSKPWPGLGDVDPYYFCGCTSLKSISLPASYKPEIFPAEFFKDCESLQSVDLPKGIKTIGRSAFRNCFSLKKIAIPEGCVEIGWNAFVNCTHLNKVVLPEGLEVIDWNAFENCRALGKITIPNSIKKIGSNAFAGCLNIKITAPDFVDVAAVLRGEQWEKGES